jgi:hypothetical protein
MAMLRMEARRMTPSDPQQARHRLFGNLHEPRRGSDTPACIEMVDDLLRGGRGALGVA